MPDIFGRNEHDYAHIRHLREANMYEAQMRALTNRGMRPYDFGALRPRAGFDGSFIVRTTDTAQALGYLTNNLQAIQAQVEEVMYSEFRLDDFIPLRYDIPEGAVTYAYKVVDGAARGRFIELGGSNAPPANVGVRLESYILRYGGIVPEWSVEDLRRAELGGVPLDTETLMLGIRGSMNHIEIVGLQGETEQNLVGLTNLPIAGRNAVNRRQLGTTFAAGTAENIRKEITDEIGKVIEMTSEIFGRQVRSGLTVYLPVEQYNLVTTRPIGDNVDKSVWDYVKMNNPWSNYTGQEPMIQPVAELKDAGGTGVDRMIVTVRDERVMEMAIPISPRVLTTLNMGYTICAPMEYKVSGLNVKRPKVIFYVDNV